MIMIIIISVVVVAVLNISGRRGKESVFLVNFTSEISTAEQARNLFICIWGQLQSYATP